MQNLGIIAVGFAVCGTIWKASNAAVDWKQKELELKMLELHAPKHFDENKTRQILKQQDLKLYFEKEKDYQKIVNRFGEYTRHPEEATPGNMLSLLNELRNSPFYHDERCKPAYKNLWLLASKGVDMLPVEVLHPTEKEINSACRDSKMVKIGDKDVEHCDKAALLFEIHVRLANDGDNLMLKPASSKGTL